MSNWLKVDIDTTSIGVEPVASVILGLGLSYEVDDPSDFEDLLAGKNGHWDYIDGELMKNLDRNAVLTVYLADNDQGVQQLAEITRGLDRLKFIAEDGLWGTLDYKLSGVKEEDWATAWKEYYKPIEISDTLTICPSWLEAKQTGQTIVYMDPGMAFGTGTHESTSICLRLLCALMQGDERVLDIGCGSGILSISALKLGAATGVGRDIDQNAVGIATENARINGVDDRVDYKLGSFADGINEQFDIVFANIVADAIIEFSHDLDKVLSKKGFFICSGIIDERADDVITALADMNFVIKQRLDDNGWVGFAFEKREKI